MMTKCKWWPNDDLILTKWWANDDLLPQAPAPPAPRVAPAVGGGAGGLAAQRVHLLHPRQGEAAGHLHQRSRAVSGNLISMWKIRKNVYNFLSNCLIVKNMEKMSLIYNIFCHIFSPVSVLTIMFRNNMYYGMVLSYFYKYILWLHKILCQREKIPSSHYWPSSERTPSTVCATLQSSSTGGPTWCTPETRSFSPSSVLTW